MNLKKKSYFKLILIGTFTFVILLFIANILFPRIYNVEEITLSKTIGIFVVSLISFFIIYFYDKNKDKLMSKNEFKNSNI